MKILESEATVVGSLAAKYCLFMMGKASELLGVVAAHHIRLRLYCLLH